MESHCLPSRLFGRLGAPPVVVRLSTPVRQERRSVLRVRSEFKVFATFDEGIIEDGMVIDRYVTKEFLRFFALVLAGLMVLSVIVDFFERVRMFLHNDATLDQVLRYFVFTLPMLFSIVAPAAFFIAVLVAVSNLSLHQEITAMKANGISVFRIGRPILMLAVFFSAFFFIFNEFVTPRANEQRERVVRVEIQKQQPAGVVTRSELWYRGGAGVYHFRLVDALSGVIHGVTISQVDQNFNLIRRLDAERAIWKDGRWVFQQAMITHFDGKGSPVVEIREETLFDMPEKPQDFKDLQKSPEKMGFFELGRFIDRIRAEGFDATAYETDWHGKLAFSFVNILLAVVGISFSLKTERSGAMARSIVAGIVLGFGYWIVFASALSLGRGEMLPPIVAAWLANVIFGVLALYLVSRVET